MNVVSKTVAHSRGKTVFIGLPISLEEKKKEENIPHPFPMHTTHMRAWTGCVCISPFFPTQTATWRKTRENK